MSTKNVNNYKLTTFPDIFGQLHTQEYKTTKKQIVRFQLNEKKSKESQTRLMVLRGPENWTIFMDIICVSSLIE